MTKCVTWLRTGTDRFRGGERFKGLIPAATFWTTTNKARPHLCMPDRAYKTQNDENRREKKVFWEFLHGNRWGVSHLAFGYKGPRGNSRHRSRPNYTKYPAIWLCSVCHWRREFEEERSITKKGQYLCNSYAELNRIVVHLQKNPKPRKA